MSQHSQLLAGSGFVPADGQRGAVTATPFCLAPAARPCPRQVATLGIGPGTYLRRALLWRGFGVANVVTLAEDAFTTRPVPAGAVVIHHLAQPPTWADLLAWAGESTVIVDVQIAAAMAVAGGDELRVHLTSGEVKPALQVMCHQENRAVYPQAPAVDIVAPPPVPAGVAVGDRVHLYAPSPIDMGLRVLTDNEALAAFAQRFGATVWGRSSQTQGAALLSCPTPAGGLVTIMDLHTVDRTPEPNGSETVAIQLFLALLGPSVATFGKFVVPHATYAEFVAELHALVARHPRFAALERIGRSEAGRALWLLKIARQPELPVVLLSNAVHPYEWGPIYGVWRYLQFLLDRLEQGGWEADELLGERQVWWIPCVCPDGFDNRQQQPTGINLNRNFPGGWERSAPGNANWGSFGAPPALEELAAISVRGPGPGSQPETQALMGLFQRGGPPIVAVTDFHENTGTGQFLGHHEHDDGTIADLDYHVEVLEGVCQAFGDRFYEQRDRAFGRAEHRAELSPNRVCSWLRYAIEHGAKGLLVEACGGDCTHYRTIRRTEYAAQVVEQVLAAELGRLYRNPWGHERTVTITPRRRPAEVVARLCDAAGRVVAMTRHAQPEALTFTVPPGGCLRLRYKF